MHIVQKTIELLEVFGTIIKNPQILRFVPDHLKCKKCVNMQFKIVFLIRYFPDQYKTHRMCDKVVVENGGTLKFIPDSYKNKKMCNQAVDNYIDALDYVPDCYKTQKMNNKVVDTNSATTRFISEWFKTQEMCNKDVNTCAFIFNSVPH